ncbi:hypothetical protein Q7P35_003426 [Cladosporium inversicolor]
MSQSPRDVEDVQHSAQSPDDDVPQPTEGDAGDMNRPELDLGYDFEVKEQDRWLPIANVRTIGLPGLRRIRGSSESQHSAAFDSRDRSSTSPPQQRSSSSASKNADKAHLHTDANIQNFAPVARIMKSALPENAKIAKEAKECMQECVSEFISFITSEASEKCQQEKRKTVNGEDILFAMTSLGFENYGEALKIYLARILLPVASINALVNPALREKLFLLTTALTTPVLSETPWIHPRKAPPTLPAIQSRMGLSTRGDGCDLQRHEPTLNLCELSYPFDVFMLLSDYPWSENAYRQGPQISVAGHHRLGSNRGYVETRQHEQRFKPAN